MADDQPTTKRCYACKTFKPLTEFNRSSRSPDGRRADCRECHNAASRAHDHANRDRLRDVRKSWQKANPERVAGYHKKWAQKNAAHLGAYFKEYKLKNPERARGWAKKHFDAHREAILAANRARWPEVRERTREARARYTENNRKMLSNLARQYKARKRGAEGSHTVEDLVVLFKAQKGRCAYCRAPLKDGYSVDHIRALSKGGSNWPSNIQLVCTPCNSAKKDRDPLEYARRKGLLL